MTRAEHASKLVSIALAAMIPACMGLYWIVVAWSPETAYQFFRPALALLSMALSALWYHLPVTRAEKKLVIILALLCAVVLASSWAAADHATALQEWAKLTIISMIAVLATRFLRHGPTARAFGASLIFASAITGSLLVWVYVRRMGVTLPTYTTARVFKEVAMRMGLPLNPIGFSCVFSYLCGMCLVRPTRFLWMLGGVLLVVSSVLTGSRAPVAAILLAAIVLCVINASGSRQLLAALTGWLAAILLLVATSAVPVTLGFDEMSRLTEQRWAVWSVALSQWADQPILGNGYASWPVAISNHVPTAHLESGGYHNEFLTALAEQGALGFIAFISILLYLFRCCWNLAFMPSHTWRNGQWALFACLVLLARALVEVPGLFGYAQEPADFLAYLFLSIVVSRISVEEDYARALIQDTAPNQTPLPMPNRSNSAVA
jgi:O-antigen ligase